MFLYEMTLKTQDILEGEKCMFSLKGITSLKVNYLNIIEIYFYACKLHAQRKYVKRPS